MSEMDHWHPVLLSRELRGRPRGVKIAGTEIAIFRTRDERLGALQDHCPHRRMRLSEGVIDTQGRLVCPYHGWSFDPEGRGFVPATPRFQPCATTFDIVERHGVIWVKSRGVEAKFPEFELPNCTLFYLTRSRWEAPLELLVDNLTDVEHVGEVHRLLAHGKPELAHTKMQCDTGDDRVRIRSRGPQRRLPWLVERFAEILFHPVKSGDYYNYDVSVYFSPVFITIDEVWTDAQGNPRPHHIRAVHLFTPLDEQTTDMFIFVYANTPKSGRFGLNRLTRFSMWAITHYEIHRDFVAIHKIASKDPSLRGMKLSRFDRPLGETRRLIEKIYRRKHASATVAQLAG